MSTDADPRTIVCPAHPARLTATEARDLAGELLDRADTVSPRNGNPTRQQVLLELEALRARVSALAEVIDERLPSSP